MRLTLFGTQELTLREALKRKNEGLSAKFTGQLGEYRTLLTTTHTRNYTPHDYGHSEKVEQIADALLPDQFKEMMTSQEIFILLQAIYLHDTGMSDQAIAKLISSRKLDNWSRVRIEELARSIHSTLSRSFIHEHAEDYGLNRAQASIVGAISRAHSDRKEKGKDRVYTFRRLLEEEETTSIGVETVRVHMLAAILRMADELDVDAERTSIRNITEIEEMPQENRAEWLKHWLIHGVFIDANSWEIYLSISHEDLSTLEDGELIQVSEFSEDVRDSLTQKERRARNNRHLTDVTIKIRRTLQLVAPVLKRYGIYYETIMFRDPLVVELREQLKRYYINQMVTRIPAPNPVDKKEHLQDILSGIEQCKLSPEYRVCRILDERLQMRGRLSDWYVKARSQHKNLADMIVECLLNDLEVMWKKIDRNHQSTTSQPLETIDELLSSLAARSVQTGQNLSGTSFRQQFEGEDLRQRVSRSRAGEDSTGASDAGAGDEEGDVFSSVVDLMTGILSSAHLGDIDRMEAASSLSGRLDGDRDRAGELLDMLQPDSSTSDLSLDSFLKGALDCMQEDFSLKIRLAVLEQKLDEHMFISIFSKQYFWTLLGEVQQKSQLEREIIGRSLRNSLEWLSRTMKAHPLTFLVYCFDGDLSGDYVLHSSEVLIWHSGTQAVVSIEQDDLAAFHADVQALLDDERCYWITWLDPETGRLEFESVEQTDRRLREGKRREHNLIREILGKRLRSQMAAKAFGVDLSKSIEVLLILTQPERREPGPDIPTGDL